MDQVTDCMDLFELVTNTKGLSTDKSQRLAIMALREDRMTGRVRCVVHVPPKAMLVDGMTKEGIFDMFLCFLTSGVWRVALRDDQWIRLRRRRPQAVYTEADLENMTW